MLSLSSRTSRTNDTIDLQEDNDARITSLTGVVERHLGRLSIDVQHLAQDSRDERDEVKACLVSSRAYTAIVQVDSPELSARTIM